jgi:diketogulonate reductase-like aldo/keto reductase
VDGGQGEAVRVPQATDTLVKLPAVQAANAAHDILTQAWSPIGGITSYRGAGTSTFDAPTIASIAATHVKPRRR